MDRITEIGDRLEAAMVDGGFKLYVDEKGQLCARDLLEEDTPPIKVYVHNKTIAKLRVAVKPKR